MKILLLGAKGQLGTDIQAAAAEGDAFRIQPVGRDDVDLSDLAKARAYILAQSFDVLVNCSSYHKTDEVESNAQQGVLINGHLVRDLAGLCQEKAARFVHISTDYVYGGQAQRTPLSEEAGVAPLNVYGATKVLGESLALATHDDTLVLRVSSLFGVAGASGKGGNFVETMIRLAKQNGFLKVVNDQIMAPTATADIATALLKLLEARADAGIWHVSGTGAASWFDFACEIVAQAGLNVPVSPVETKDMPTPAKRPPYSVLSNDKLFAATNWRMPAWQDSLRRYLAAKGHIA